MLDTIYHNADCKKATISVALSAAFNYIDIDTLVHHLKLTFGISGSALSWVRSCLTDRKQFVHVGNSKLTPAVCKFGILYLGLYSIHCMRLLWEKSFNKLEHLQLYSTNSQQCENLKSTLSFNKHVNNLSKAVCFHTRALCDIR